MVLGLGKVISMKNGVVRASGLYNVSTIVNFYTNRYSVVSSCTTYVQKRTMLSRAISHFKQITASTQCSAHAQSVCGGVQTRGYAFFMENFLMMRKKIQRYRKK